MKDLKPLKRDKVKGKYEAKIQKINKMLYNYQIFLGNKQIVEKKEVHYDNVRKLQNDIYKFMDDWDKDKGLRSFINDLIKWVKSHADKMRDIILERDEFKCQLCSKKKNLQMHHIIYIDEYSEFLSKILEKDKLISSEKIAKYYSEYIINDYHNLITLCENCHRQIKRTDFIYLLEKAIENTHRKDRFSPAKLKIRELKNMNKELNKRNNLLKKILLEHGIKNYQLF